MNCNRKLFPDERGMTIINEYSGCFSIGGVTQVKGELKSEILRQSLDFVQEYYPRLNCRIVGDANNFEFQQEGTAKIPLNIIEESETRTWKDIVVSECNIPFPKEQYLIKCFLVLSKDAPSNYYFITVTHHSVTDGLSIFRLHDLILKSYAQFEKEITPEKPTIKIVENHQTIPWQTQSFCGILSSLISWMKLQVLGRYYSVKRLTPEKYIPIEERKSNFIHRDLDEELTARITKKCQKEKAQVHGALSAAMLLTLAEEIREKEDDKFNLSCQSFVDLRSKLQPRVSNQYMALMISSLFSFHEISNKTGFWNLARDVDRQLQTELQRKDFLRYPILLDRVTELALSTPEKYTQTTSVSNVGKVRIRKNYGSLEIENLYFFMNVALFTNLIVLGAYNFQKKLNFTFSFSDPSISEEIVERVAKGVREKLSIYSSS